ncbi:MAG TPA: ABC transporter permease [Sphingomonas sp.]|uniref:ABC transporter permease n=1 Tax=Sphingomonas sp. TaxID=28214 RepID=UPI002BED86F2|nr:ABC transporter permease [Sphingomonas sp.]HMI20967.1 ABC transporter permease [Sphingomonas sp.]
MTATTAAPRGSFLKALTIQTRVLGALILRELHTRYGRENVGYLWMFLEPMILASVIGLLHYETGHTAYGGDIKPLPFGVIGYTTFILFRGIVNRAEGAIEANAPLLYHRSVTVLDIILARAMLEFAAVFSTFAIIMTLIVCVGLADPPARPLYLMLGWALMWFYCLGHSLIITAFTYERRTLGRFVHPYSYFMTGLSGAFYQVGWLPSGVRAWASWLPTTTIFETVRYGWFESANDDYAYYGYCSAFCLISIWIGLVAVRRTRDRIHLA